jgi:regulator of PEP synthase PpsR (kinase-PPPase family)
VPAFHGFSDNGTETVCSEKAKGKKVPPPVYIVSGGSGASGQQIVETALAQFPKLDVPVIKRGHVRNLRQIREVVKKASVEGGTVVLTLVERGLRDALVHLGRKHGVVTIDLMGPLLERVAAQSRARPLEKPGLYRKLRKDYFDRVEAIDFTVVHDDGKMADDLPGADIVILGVSRCGKTPLSMYLAVHGWKVANVPILKGIPLPDEVYRTDRRKVIGLSIEYTHLMEHRKRREVLLGAGIMTDYSRPSVVFAEVEAARKIYRDGGFHVVDVTDKPIEIVAGEILQVVTGGRKEPQRPPLPP